MLVILSGRIRRPRGRGRDRDRRRGDDIRLEFCDNFVPFMDDICIGSTSIYDW